MTKNLSYSFCSSAVFDRATMAQLTQTRARLAEVTADAEIS